MTTEKSQINHKIDQWKEGQRARLFRPEQEGMEGNETPITTLITLKWRDHCRAPYLAAEFVVLKAVQRRKSKRRQQQQEGG